MLRVRLLLSRLSEHRIPLMLLETEPAGCFSVLCYLHDLSSLLCLLAGMGWGRFGPRCASIIPPKAPGAGRLCLSLEGHRVTSRACSARLQKAVFQHRAERGAYVPASSSGGPGAWESKLVVTTLSLVRAARFELLVQSSPLIAPAGREGIKLPLPPLTWPSQTPHEAVQACTEHPTKKG